MPFAAGGQLARRALEDDLSSVHQRHLRAGSADILDQVRADHDGGVLAEIAQAIVNDPELLLLDEPTAGLDPEQRVTFRALLRDLGQSATIVVSTHLVEDVGAACAQVALMDQGKIIFFGTPGDLTARGAGHDTGDAPLERGYSAVLAAARP